jgi:hypothetical protein
MDTLTKYFTDKLRAALRFFHRPTAEAATTVASEPPAAGTQSWLTAPAGALSWEDALSGAAHRQQAKQPID